MITGQLRQWVRCPDRQCWCVRGRHSKRCVRRLAPNHGITSDDAEHWPNVLGRQTSAVMNDWDMMMGDIQHLPFLMNVVVVYHCWCWIAAWFCSRKMLFGDYPHASSALLGSSCLPLNTFADEWEREERRLSSVWLPRASQRPWVSMSAHVGSSEEDVLWPCVCIQLISGRDSCVLPSPSSVYDGDRVPRLAASAHFY